MTTTELSAASTDALRGALDELRRMDPQPQVRLALAEGEFRLALAAGTPVDEGIALLRSALGHDPFLVKGYLHLGRLLHRRGRHRAATAEYLAGIELAPTSRRIHLLLAEALLELGKEAEQAGEDLIRAVAEGDPERLRTTVATVRAVLSGDGTGDATTDGAGAAAGDGDQGEQRTKTRSRAARRRSAPPPSDLGDVWLVWLLAQLGRQAKPAQVAAALQAGATRTGRTELAVGCLLVLLAGHPPDLVRRALAAAGREPLEPDSPAGRALTAVLELVEAPDPATFLRAAAVHVTDGAVPATAVCVLHYDRFGPADRSLAEAVAMVDAHPAAVQRDDGWQELRIAVLDHFAAQAWDTGALAQARLLWREALAVDPLRVPVAVNLALLAARANAAEEYQSAWERLFELLYLLAAGMNDVQFLLSERRDLHLALWRQGWQRHCGATPPTDPPSRDELDAWLADADALDVWLRDWDGYYVNARLSFRSPVHVLGVPRDVSAPALTEARDALVRHIDTVVAGRGWAGTEAFRRLAVAVVDDAHDRTVEPVDRARDPYYEAEKTRADELAIEVVARALVLHSLVGALARTPAGAVPAREAAAVIRRQRLLPQATLRSLLVGRGLVEVDVDPAEVFEEAAVRLAATWMRGRPDAEAEPATVAAALDAVVEVLPGSLTLRAYHARVLYDAKRPRDAYATALAGLRLPLPTADDAAAELRGDLLDVLDRVGSDAIASVMRTSLSVETAAQVIVSLTAALETYPASAALRVLLADLQVRLDRATGGATRQRPVAALLMTGIVDAVDERQSDRFASLLATLDPAHATEAVRAAAVELAARPPAADPSAAGVAVGQLTRCLAVARRYALATEVAALERVLDQYRTAE